MTLAPPLSNDQPKEAPPEDGDAAAHLDEDALDRLRELRAEVQDLKDVLADVRQGKAAIQTYAEYIQTTKDDVASLIENIHDGDNVRHILNIWEQMTACPLLVNPEGEFGAQQQLQHLDTLDKQISRIIFLVGALTIPNRVNDWLAKARPGYYVPFHSVFEDELPTMEDRVRVLNLLAWSPEVIHGGIVDAASGLIYRYNRDPKQRTNSFLYLILGFVVATAIVIGVSFLPAPGWPLTPENLSATVIGWGAALVGAVVHVGVSSVKRRQQQGGLPPVVAVGDLLLLVDARLGELLLKLLLILIGFFGLIFSMGIAQVTIFNAFLMGYSLDSFIELFGANIEQQATAQISSLKQQMGVS